MKRYIQFLEEIAEDGIVTNGFGDWYDPPAEGPEAISVPNPKYTSTGVTTTSLYCAALQIMIRICELLENEDDIGYYQRLEAETRDGFNKHFYTAESAYGSQTANTVALRYNLVKEENREHVLNALIEDIAAHDYHFTTGVQGAKHLYNVLSENGYGDVAYQVITNKTFPSIPYLFSLGATTNWENWSTTPNQRGVPRSKNHPMNTGYASWFFQSVGGIKPDPGIPGFKRTILSPGFNPYLEWARASYNSPYGEIISSWRRENNEILWQISVPPNSTAEIILPAGGFDISGGLEEGIIEKTEKGSYMIGSGNYNVLVSESREVLQSD